MANVTAILDAAARGEPQAAAELLPLVYDELRKLAAARLVQERPGQTLQATALVHEAYLRLVGKSGNREQNTGENDSAAVPCRLSPVSFSSRGHFFAAAAEAMRRILIDAARHKRSLKAGGGMTRVDWERAEISTNHDPDDLLAVDEALTKLAADDPAVAQLAKLRLFAGLSVEEAAESLDISRTTAFRHWTYARAFLQAELAKS